jgi:hypothetical protein
MSCEASDVLGARRSDERLRSHRRGGGWPRSGVLEVVAGAPTVAVSGEAVGRLTEERRLLLEPLDACPGGLQLLLSTGDIAFGVGQSSGQAERLAGRLGAREPIPALSAGVVELAPGTVGAARAASAAAISSLSSGWKDSAWRWTRASKPACRRGRSSAAPATAAIRCGSLGRVGR